ncbi:nucleoid-associated protein [Streptococcus sp. DD13]|uniref:nucleoid-associated protein n=1 Tax=Streptococcus sp. DD13 TaxID=1777881 RepID=UPI0008370504|nr:nucleoid-associated protein [Streptococcus sp. DD13]
MDIYIKEAIIHQFSPDDTELVLADSALDISPKIEEYLRKKIERVYSDEAKTGQFSEDQPFMSYISNDLMASSIQLAQAWKEEFIQGEQFKTNDLVFIRFETHGIEHFAFLRLVLRDSLVHITNEAGQTIQLSQNNFPGAGSAPDEALIINLSDKSYYLIEKRIKANGAFVNYLSQHLLQVEPRVSAKKSIKEVEKVAQKIAGQFHQDDFQFQSKLKSTLHQHIEENQSISPEKMADQLFDDNLTARLSFIDQVKESVPEELSFSGIDTSRQLKRLENQKLSLSNGIELIVPNQVYEDAESVEFIQNSDGTYSILIKNIEDIKSQ